MTSARERAVRMRNIGKPLAFALIAFFLAPAAGRADNNLAGEGLGYHPAADRPVYGAIDRGDYDVVNMMRGVKLTDEQKALIDGIMNLNKEKMQKTDEKLKLARANMYDQLRSGVGDDDIRKRFQELEALRNEMDALRLDNLLAIRTTLTPEQQRQLQSPEEIMGGRREQGGRRMGHEPGGGRGRGGMGGRGGIGGGW